MVDNNTVVCVAILTLGVLALYSLNHGMGETVLLVFVAAIGALAGAKHQLVRQLRYALAAAGPGPTNPPNKRARAGDSAPHGSPYSVSCVRAALPNAPRRGVVGRAMARADDVFFAVR
jgi:hypothetical protein